MRGGRHEEDGRVHWAAVMRNEGVEETRDAPEEHLEKREGTGDRRESGERRKKGEEQRGRDTSREGERGSGGICQQDSCRTKHHAITATNTTDCPPL